MLPHGQHPIPSKTNTSILRHPDSQQSPWHDARPIRYICLTPHVQCNQHIMPCVTHLLVSAAVHRSTLVTRPANTVGASELFARACLATHSLPTSQSAAFIKGHIQLTASGSFRGQHCLCQWQTGPSCQYTTRQAHNTVQPQQPVSLATWKMFHPLPCTQNCPGAVQHST
jgi:hypothetical protein